MSFDCDKRNGTMWSTWSLAWVFVLPQTWQARRSLDFTTPRTRLQFVRMSFHLLWSVLHSLNRKTVFVYRVGMPVISRV